MIAVDEMEVARAYREGMCRTGGWAINATNVTDAYRKGMSLLHRYGEREETRNGPAIVAPGPVITTYARPWERVMMNPERDANPFFHLFEAIWMMAGREDVAPLLPYVKRMADYSDNGKTLTGAYGRRWAIGDQLAWVIAHLRKTPNSRRAVITMYDAATDTPRINHSLDIPCNLTAALAVRNGALCLTVFCRSNDAVWGAYGANAVHFSVLQEFLASALGLRMGTYTQISNNFHAYPPAIKGADWAGACPYEHGQVCADKMFANDWKVAKPWLGMRRDFNAFVDDIDAPINDLFLTRVARPMLKAYHAFRQGENPWELLRKMPAKSDWKRAAAMWFENRS